MPRPVYASYTDAPPAAFAALSSFIAEANLWTPNLWTPIPAFDMVPGKVYVVRFGGIMQSASAVNWTFTPRFGQSATPSSNISLGASAVVPAAATIPASSPFWGEFAMVVQAINNAASLAKVTGNGFVVIPGSAVLAGQTIPMGGTLVTTADWTTAQGLVVSATCGTSAATNLIQAQWVSTTS